MYLREASPDFFITLFLIVLIYTKNKQQEILHNSVHINNLFFPVHSILEYEL